MVTSLRLETWSRLALELRGQRLVARTEHMREFRDPWDSSRDYLAIFYPDPGAAVEPPGYETLYVTGGEYRA